MTNQSTKWYAEWFGKKYLELYAHRNDDEAKKQVDSVCKLLETKGSLRVLDIACGNGRHLLKFAEKGHRVAGIDLSRELIQTASMSFLQFDLDCPIVRGDMRRLPFEDKSFDLVTSFFTSFGYFDSDEVHLLLLKEWKRVTAAGGELVLDYLNRSHVISHLVPLSVDETPEYRLEQRRSISADGSRVNKEIMIQSKEGGDISKFNESVRMYQEEELLSLLDQAGYERLRSYGSFSGDEARESSPRLIVFAKAGRPRKKERDFSSEDGSYNA